MRRKLHVCHLNSTCESELGGWKVIPAKNKLKSEIYSRAMRTSLGELLRNKIEEKPSSVSFFSSYVTEVRQ